MQKKKIETFMADFNAFNSNTQSMYDSIKKSTFFLDLMLLYTMEGLRALHTLNPLTDINICTIHPHIPSIQTLCVSRIFSREKDFQDCCLQIRSWFLKRKYPEKIIDNEMEKVRFFPANLQNKKREKVVPSVVTYHPILNGLSKII